MKTALLLTCLFVFSASPILATTLPAKYSFLPDPTAQTVSGAISRNDAIMILSRRYPPDAQASPEEIKALLKRALTEELCVSLVRSMLIDAGIKPSTQTAKIFLEEQEKGLPAALGLTPLTELQKNALINDELYILAVSLREYFRKVDPVKSEISDIEAEYFYRSHQLRFLKEARAEITFIAVPSSELSKLQELRATLLQAPETKVFIPSEAQVDPVSRQRLVNEFISLDKQTPNPIGAPSSIIQIPGVVGFGIVHSRASEEYITFDEVKLPIKNYLQFRRGNIELQKILEANIQKLQLNFNF